MKKSWVWVLVLVAMGACSASPKQAPAPVRVEPVKKQVPKRVDPFEERLNHFKAAYEDMACKANRDFDPTGAVVTLRDPYDLLKDLQEQQAVTLEIYERILQRRGFKDVNHFFKEREYINTARPKWFRKLQNSLYDIVIGCEAIDKGVKRELD